jgi:Na+/H+-dicarboxylate symporter
MRAMVYVLTGVVFLAPFFMVGLAVWVFRKSGIRRALKVYAAALLILGIGLAAWLGVIILAVRPN